MVSARTTRPGDPMEKHARTDASGAARTDSSAIDPLRACRCDWGLPAKYEARRVIGTGAMGTVLLARDKSLGRLVAIKVLRTDCSDFLARLKREARLLARLDHPAIVRVHDLDVHRGRLYLAMEYAPGGNLALARLAPERLVRTIRGVVDALAHAHEQGIVHRDVKPENVLLTSRNGREAGARAPAMLSDFGLAAGPREGSPTLRRPIVGTPLTMSPEQANGEAVCPASDAFSLGVTLYRQLTGRWPFRGRNVVDVLEAIRTQPTPPMGVAQATGAPVPRPLERIVQRALAKDPRDRFESMEELGRALDRFLRPPSFFALSGWLRHRRVAPAAAPHANRPRIHPEV